MIFRSLDTQGDWNFGKGKQDMLYLVDAIKANIKTRILSWVGDCFFSMESGIDWYNRMGQTGQRELLESDLRRIITQSEGVTGITSFDSTLIDRSFSVSFSVDTVYSKSFTDTLVIEV
jgi:hypothetical protein